MSKETELKFELDEKDFSILLNKFQNPIFFEQRNIFFRIDNKYLRVRHEKGNIIINCKGKRENDKFGSREELEFACTDRENNIENIFQSLGFEKSLDYKKKRAEFFFENCVISFDIIENRFFVEIEGKEQDIEMVLQTLELNHKSAETKSYLEILSG